MLSQRHAPSPALRRSFGQVAGLSLHAAPAPNSHLRYAFVQLPASAADMALQELNGLCVFELSAGLQLRVKQSERTLKPLRQQQQQQQWRAPPPAPRTPAAPASGSGPAAAAADWTQEGWEAVREAGSVAPLQGPVCQVSKQLVCEGPPSSTLWLGNVGGHVTPASLSAFLAAYGSVGRVMLGPAPGYKNSFQFAFVDMGSEAEAERVHRDLQARWARCGSALGWAAAAGTCAHC